MTEKISGLMKANVISPWFRWNHQIWKKQNKAYKNNCLRFTVKHGGGFIMIWDSMSWKRMGTMVINEEIMAKEFYLRL